MIAGSPNHLTGADDDEVLLVDMGGNIGEWCADYAADDYYRKPSSGNLIKDPQGPSGRYLRVYRLGCQCKHATTKVLHGFVSTPLRTVRVERRERLLATRDVRDLH